MTEAARNIPGKFPDNRFALARPLCLKGLKSMALPLNATCESLQP